MDVHTEAGGNLVQLTESAKAEVRRLLTDQTNAGKGLRLGIKGGGCSGLSYVREFDDKREGETVISYDDFLAHKGEAGAKEAGRWRLEGKEYVVQDGDVVHFRFNV